MEWHSLEHCYIFYKIIWLPVLQPTEDKDHVLLSEDTWCVWTAKYKFII